MLLYEEIMFKCTYTALVFKCLDLSIPVVGKSWKAIRHTTLIKCIIHSKWYSFQKMDDYIPIDSVIKYND